MRLFRSKKQKEIDREIERKKKIAKQIELAEKLNRKHEMFLNHLLLQTDGTLFVIEKFKYHEIDNEVYAHTIFPDVLEGYIRRIEYWRFDDSLSHNGIRTSYMRYIKMKSSLSRFNVQITNIKNETK